MMLIYLPVTFEFDRTNRFRVRVRKQKIGQGLLLTGDPHVVVVPPKYFFHAINVQQLIYVLYNNKCKIKKEHILPVILCFSILGKNSTRQMNGRIYTNFERNLAMMVMYVPVKFELDWSNRFRVRVRKQKCGRTDEWTEKRTKTKKRTEKRTNKQTEFHQFRKEPSYDGDLSPCEV